MAKTSIGELIGRAAIEIMRREPMTHAGASAKVMTMTYDELVKLLDSAGVDSVKPSTEASK